MRGSTMLLLLLPASAAFAAEPAPEFSPAGVARGAEPARILEPGAAGMTIYGAHLALQECSSRADPQQRETLNPGNLNPNFANLSVYPKELCGVQVLIGDKPAGLLYVSPKQINFKIPQDIAESGMVDLRVISQGQSSAPVRFPAGFEKTSISLYRSAYTDMPVWLKVTRPFGLGHVGYPSPVGSAGFGCDEVEVRRDGKPLPLLPGANWMRYGAGGSGPICGSYALPAGTRFLDVLPLHLLYRFDTPGTYEARYTLRSRPMGWPSASEVRAQSEWTTIEVLPAAPNHRREFLDSVSQRELSASELLTDVLPSVLGLPDDASFEIVAQNLYHSFPGVRRYAMYGLSYWPEDSTSVKLLALLKTKGPSDELVRFLTRQSAFSAAHAAEIVAASMPYLDSDSPVAIDGALTALMQAAPASDPAVLSALLRTAEHIVPRADVQNRGNVTQILAWSKSEPAHALLRKLVDEGYDMAAQSLVLFADPNDLPSLAALLQPAPSTTNEPAAYLPRLLYQAFGNGAVPYLKTALLASPGRFTEKSIALQLMSAGDRSGFQYALRVIGLKGGPRMDMLQSVKSQLAELKSQSDDEIIAFVTARAGN